MATFLLHPHMAENARALVSSFFIGALILSWGSTFKTSAQPNHLPKVPSPNTLIGNLCFHIWISGSHKHLVQSRDHCEQRSLQAIQANEMWTWEEPVEDRSGWMWAIFRKVKSTGRWGWAEEITTNSQGAPPLQMNSRISRRKRIQSKHPCVACSRLPSVEVEIVLLTLLEENRVPRRTEDWL